LLTGLLSPSPAAAETSSSPSGQTAVRADFDGDGIVDAAVLADGVITIRLSEEGTTVRLEALPDTTGLVAIDIDKDGDTDLLSLTLDGRSREWTNERSGLFSARTTGPPAARFPSPTAEMPDRISERGPGAPVATTGSSGGYGIVV